MSLSPSGKYEKCHEIAMPLTKAYSGNLHLKGNLSGLKVNDTVTVSIKQDNDQIYIQTDRYKYRPGEQVQFRLLTITGNKLKVSTENVSIGS